MKHIDGAMPLRWTSAESMHEWYYLIECLHYASPLLPSCKKWPQLSCENPTAKAGQLCQPAAKSLWVSREKGAVCVVQHITEAEEWARRTRRKASWELQQVWILGHLFPEQERTRATDFKADINDKPLKKLQLLNLFLHKATLIWCESNYGRSSLITPRKKFKVHIVSWIFIGTLVINQRKSISIQLHMPQTSRTEITIVFSCCRSDIKFCASPHLHLVRKETSQAVVWSLECYKNKL